MTRNRWLLLLALTFALALALAYCSRANIAADPTATPTLPVSATPSDTPALPTATATLVVTVSGSPLPATATGTAVTPLPGMTLTAVPSPTPTATPTAPPEPTATLAFWLVQPGDNLSLISEWLCGRQDWVWIYVENQDIIRNPDIIFSGQRLIIPWPCPE